MCAKCNKQKFIWNKSRRLCKLCYQNDLAPEVLHKYIVDFSSPYPYNAVLFDLLAESIDWSSVNARTLQRFRVFGRFLQTNKLKEPLTWKAIEEALPPWNGEKSTAMQMIRSCLLSLGYLLAVGGKLESRETYALRRNALAPIDYAPEFVQPVLQRYSTWLWERKNVPTNVGDHLEVLAAFWSWCDARGIWGLEGIHSALINDYLLTLYWQWQCSACLGTLAYDPHDREAPGACSHCGTIGSLSKEKRYSQNTVRQHRGKLLVFFDWAKLNRLVIANPVQRKVQALPPTIQHYPPEVVRQLCTYLASSDAHPIEALILYLIVFHACSVWELRHAQLPTLYQLHNGTERTTLAESYFILVPRPAPSLGDHSPGRLDIAVSFPQEAAPWLRPLLKRYVIFRQHMVKNASNHYLLFSPITARHDIPVGITYVQKIVRRASMRVLGKACAPNTLRKTTGIMFADRAGAGVLRFLGWDAQQAFDYSAAERKLVHPREIGDFS